MESHDAPGVNVGQDEHVQVKGRCEDQGDEEEGDKADDDSIVGVVENEEGASGDAGRPHNDNDGDSALGRHDAVVTQRVKYGDVTISGDGAKERQ